MQSSRPASPPPHRRLQSVIQLFAWAGAAVFLASLLWFLYCYLFRFGRSTEEPGTVTVPLVVDVLLFSIFASHHSAFARTGIKQWMRRIVPPELERSMYTWIASLLFIGVCALWRPVPGVLYQLDGVWAWVASIVQGIGIILTIRASAALDALDLAGVRSVLDANGSPRHVPLETSGLYAFVRHPLYFAWALFVFATPAMTATRAVFALVSTAYLALAIPWEERALVTLFGGAYEAYRRRVRWRMIPGLY